jgi:hypothetical protein
MRADMEVNAWSLTAHLGETLSLRWSTALARGYSARNQQYMESWAESMTGLYGGRPRWRRQVPES